MDITVSKISNSVSKRHMDTPLAKGLRMMIMMMMMMFMIMIIIILIIVIATTPTTKSNSTVFGVRMDDVFDLQWVLRTKNKERN